MRPEEQFLPSIIPIDDAHFVTIAKAEAALDGREWMAMPKADRERYTTRVRGFMPLVMSAVVPAAIAAVYPLIAKAERERCARVADGFAAQNAKAAARLQAKANRLGSDPFGRGDMMHQGAIEVSAAEAEATAIAAAIRALEDTTP